MRDFHHSMVPMAIHQVICSICSRLVEILIAVGRGLYMTLDIAYVHDLLLVGRYLEFSYTVRNLADLLRLPE